MNFTAIYLLLDYVTTYPNDGINFHASDMIFSAHADAGLHNESKARRRAGAQIFLSEDEHQPKWNGAVLTLDQIIKSVMSSAAESEMGALFITAKEIVPISPNSDWYGMAPTSVVYPNRHIHHRGSREQYHCPTKKINLGTCAITGSVAARRNVNFVFTGGQTASTGKTAAPSTIHPRTMKPNAHCLQATLIF